MKANGPFDGVLFLLPLLLHTACAQRLPFISYVSQQQVADTGDSVALQCSAPYSSGYPVLWIKARGSLPLTVGCVRIVPDTRIKVGCDRNIPAYTLQIHDVQETDAGWYQCVVLLDSTTRVAGEAEVLVRTAPFILDSGSSSVVVTEGGNVSLECSAKGFPEPKVAWRRGESVGLPDGVGPISRGNVLVLTNVSKDDRGTYQCVADNGVGRSAKRSVALEVRFPPVTSSPRPRLGQALRYDMDLDCIVEGFPAPVINWWKDGAPLVNNMYYSVSQFSTSDDVTLSTLRVSNIQKRQLGVYECVATNQLGTSKTEVVLFETVTPACPPVCDKKYFD